MNTRSNSLGVAVTTFLLVCAGCAEDNEATAKRQQAATGEVVKTQSYTSQQDYFKDAQAQMKNMPGYNEAKAKKAMQNSTPK